MMTCKLTKRKTKGEGIIYLDKSVVRLKPADYTFPQIAYAIFVVVIICTILRQFIPDKQKTKNQLFTAIIFLCM